ncbi:MAG: rod shape-determining protein MreC [Anaerolineaceae bacterium]|nr:rod shape-determining protein MreC [Anaerolineaceae bacterium]
MNRSTSRIIRIMATSLVVVGLLVLAFGGHLTPLFSIGLNPFISAQRWISTRYMAVYDFVTTPRDVASLRARNFELENEVSLLQTQIIELQQQISETRILYALLDFARANPEHTYVAASVIGRDPSPFMQYILIDKGSSDGILRGMPVVTQQGLVGRVDAMTANAARVMLITDVSSTVNIRLQTTQTEAILRGSQTSDLSVENIPQDVSVVEGDLVLTSSLGGTYPANIFVGQIQVIHKAEGQLFQSASIQPVVSFDALQSVLIITNFRPVGTQPLIPTAIP